MRFHRERSGLFLPDRELIAKPRQGIPYLAAVASGSRRGGPVPLGDGGGGEPSAMGDEPVFRFGTDTMVWEDLRTRISPEPAATYSSLIAITRNSTCPPNGDDVYGRRTLPNCNTDNEACVSSPSGFSLGTIAIPNVGDRQAMVTTISGTSEQTVSWLCPRRYSGSYQFSYTAGAEIIFEFYFQFVSGTIGGAGTKWIELWGGSHRTQMSCTEGSFGIGPWGFASSDDPLAVGQTARTPFYTGSGPGTVAYASDGDVHKQTIVYKPNSHTLVYVDGVLTVALATDYANVTPPGGSKVWCTATEVSSGQADDDDILYTVFHDVFNSPAEDAVIRTLPPRCWTRPTDFGP